MIKKFFETQEESEQVKIIIHRHWMALFWPIFVAFWTVVFGIFAIFTLPHFALVLVEGVNLNLYVLFLSTWFLSANLYFFAGWVVFYHNVGIVTDQNLVDIDQHNLLNREISTLSLKDIQDVTASRKGFLQTYLNYGDVLIQTAGTLPNFEFKKVPDPAGFAKKLLDIQEAFVKRQKRIHHKL